ncbi:Uncharacterised protein [Yersinia frederiksenii]|nr:Uncharacterised protein [Yersinia frederiksenii]
MDEFDYRKQAQDYYSQAPVVVLGSGASAAFGLPSMNTLGEYLIKSVSTSDDQRCIDVWARFTALLSEGTDLESALTQVHLPPFLGEQVVSKTWELINEIDIATYNKSLQDQNFFPLSKLIRSLFNSTHVELNIVTTNYDRLAEYAVEQAGYNHFTGFSTGFTRRMLNENNLKGRVVNIWKVHGSLDWHEAPTRVICGLSHLDKVPDGYIPQIVTPGIEKYQRTHNLPFRDIIASSDRAIQRGRSYLCIGFGFNDSHIQPKLIQKCLQENSSIVVITYSLSDMVKDFLFKQKVQQYLAIERGSNDQQSIIYSSQHDGPITVEHDCWSLGGYLKLII